MVGVLVWMVRVKDRDDVNDLPHKDSHASCACVNLHLILEAFI